MVSRGLLVRVKANRGIDDEVESFLLRSALPLALREPGTTAWFALRFGRSEFGVLGVFADEGGRDAHENGALIQELTSNVGRLFVRAPSIQKLDVIADKLPMRTPDAPVPKALLLTFKPRSGHAHDAERFLRVAETLVHAEPRTTAWFGLRLADGAYGIFDVFPDNRGRIAHLAGGVPRAMARRALSLFGSVPRMKMVDVVADKLPGPAHAA